MAWDFAEELVSDPATISWARRPAKDGGVPAVPGVYAWWLATADALPAGPARPHPNEPSLRLLYIGIAPKGATSKETLRSRILSKHAGAGLADSTFRRRLAALLWEESGWTPRLTATDRFKLSPEDDAALLGWQERHLRVSWVHVDNPWDSEPLAIREFQPPLNVAGNKDHPFYERLNAARVRFIATAKAHARDSL